MSSLLYCRSNCAGISVALNKYASEKGKYPESLTDLVPEYLEEIPLCPTAGKNTYSGSYSSVLEPVPMFTVYCKGDHHKRGAYPSNHPAYFGEPWFYVKKGKMMSNPGEKGLHLKSCRYRMELTGKALEKYGSDHGGKYPGSLGDLVPDYLESIPYCTAMESDSFIRGYDVSEDLKSFTLYCSGSRHSEQGLAENYPQYLSGKGYSEVGGRSSEVGGLKSEVGGQK